MALASSIQHGLHGTLLAVDVILGAGVTLALWWRRRWPVAVVSALFVTSLLSSSICSLRTSPPTDATPINYPEWRACLADAVLVGSVSARPVPEREALRES